MNYIVLDLEWNQGNASRERQDPVMPFEIIEIGAVRMDGERRIVGDYARRVRPSRYHSMHFVTGKLLHIRAEDLAQEEFFPGVFEERQYLLADREVMDCRCYVCGRPLRRRAVPWFTPNGRHYYCVANCPEHGYTKLKVRVRKAEDGGVYAVKTMRQISEEEKNSLRSREEKSRAAALHKSKEKGTLR